MRLWDVLTGRQLKVMTEIGGPVISVAFSPDGKTFATGGWDGIVRLWDTPVPTHVFGFGMQKTVAARIRAKI